MADRREMLEAALEDVLEPQDEGKPVDTEEEHDTDSRNERKTLLTARDADSSIRAIECAILM